MDITSKSFIEISTVTVKAHCEKTISLINKDRQTQFDTAIKDLMESFNASWWNKFRKKRMTESEASEFLKTLHDGFFLSRYEIIMGYYRNQQELCELLINLCNASETGKINLTCEDAKYINL